MTSATAKAKPARKAPAKGDAKTKAKKFPKKEASNVNVSFEDKFKKMMTDVVAKYGEGAVITRKMLLEVVDKNRDAYPHPASLEKNAKYKVGRGHYVITLSDKPEAIRDKAIKESQKVAAEKTKKQLDPSVRKSATKLADMIKTPKADKPKETKEPKESKAKAPRKSKSELVTSTPAPVHTPSPATQEQTAAA